VKKPQLQDLTPGTLLAMLVAARRLLAPIAAIAIVAALWWWLFPSEARQVRRASHDLAELISVAANEPDLARAARASRLGERLSNDLVVGVAERPDLSATKEQVLTYVARFFTSPGGITVTLDQLDVEVDQGRAGVHAVATAREPDLRGGPELVEARDVVLEYAKAERTWLLVRATLGAPTSANDQ
jgi:hypothetical protein